LISEKLAEGLQHHKKYLSVKQKQVEANEQFKQDKNKDPFLQFGFGLIAYRNLLESLIVGFFFLSCLVYPIS